MFFYALCKGVWKFKGGKWSIYWHIKPALSQMNIIFINFNFNFKVTIYRNQKVAS